jgi:hypothetical protein
MALGLGAGLEPRDAWVPALALGAIAVDTLLAIVVFGLLMAASPPALATDPFSARAVRAVVRAAPKTCRTPAGPAGERRP